MTIPQTVYELLDQLDSLARYGCADPEGDYETSMEIGAGNYVDGEEVRKIAEAIRATLKRGQKNDPGLPISPRAKSTKPEIS